MKLSQLRSGSHIHLMGICGTAMASLAGILKDMGFRITGSDLNPYPPMSTQLEKLGIAIMAGYRKENLNPRPDLVIVGNVISRTHEEAQALLASDIPYTSLPQALGEFVINQRTSLVVAGTHGKTTTTAMLAWVAECCGQKPGFLIGGVPNNFLHSFRAPAADCFVIEGDEYDTAFFDKVPKFIHYRPRHVIWTSMEFDHADIYADIGQIRAAFARLVELTPGTMVYNADSEMIEQVMKDAKCRPIGYGFSRGDYQARDIKTTPTGTTWQVIYKGRAIDELRFALFGEHNVANALAVYALTRELAWPLDKVKQGLATFTGVKRRQEVIGEPNGITVVEDFAHHPTAVKVTIESMGQRYPGRKLFAVFEPRSATSRRKVFQADYVRALTHAGETLIAGAYDQTKIPHEERFSPEQLVEDVRKTGTPAHLFSGPDDIVTHLEKHCRSGDVVLLMSNGGFGGIYQKLLKALAEARH